MLRTALGAVFSLDAVVVSKTTAENDGDWTPEPELHSDHEFCLESRLEPERQIKASVAIEANAGPSGRQIISAVPK